MATAPSADDDHRGQHGGAVEQQADADAGQRDVADAVADQRQPPLHQVDAEGGRGQADHERADQRPDHEVVLRRMLMAPHIPGGSSGACGCTWSWPGSAWWPAGSGTAPSWTISPWCTTTRPGDQRLQRAELVRDQQHGAAAGDELGAARRRTPPGWPRRPRRSARRGPAVPARRPARGRSACAAAGRRRGVATGSPARSASPTAASAAATAARSAAPGGRRMPRRASRPERDHLAHGRRHAAAGAEALRHVPDPLATAGTGAAACRTA